MTARFNLAQHLLDARLDEGRGDTPALLLPERTVSYAALAASVDATAHALVSQGVGRGDRVLIALPDGLDFAATLFATLKVGGVVAMMNPAAPADEAGRLLAFTAPRVLVAAPAVLDRLGAAVGSVTLVVGEGRTPGLPSLDELRARVPVTPFSVAETSADDVAMWLFSSGSTGHPKAAVHRHRDFAAHIQAYARGVLGMNADDVVLSVPRLHFPYATGMSLLFPCAVGARSVLYPEHPTAQRLYTLIDRFRPTILTTVPTMTAKLLAEPGAAARDLSSLRLAVTAGEALPVELHRRWLDAFGVEMLDGIGSVEMFHIYLTNRPGQSRPGSLGQPVPGYEVRIVREDGNDARDGEAGVLWVRGPSALVGYHDDPGATAAVLRDGWVVTGDFFCRAADGTLQYAGRADDMLKVGGIYVSPLEVEGVLLGHPAVAECAVVGARDQHGLVKPRAFVVPRPGHVADERLFTALAAWARERLAHYKVPRWWEASPSLPRNDRGKIVRRLLREDRTGGREG